MAYEKYIKRNGKLYGPYTYHSRRIDGKVVSEYHGPKKHKASHIRSHKKKIIIYLAILTITLLLLWVLFFNTNLTGRSIVELNDYNIPLNDSGRLEIVLNHGELIPSNSIVTIDNLGNHYEFNLNDILTEETVSGEFFLKGSALSGNGSGYGIIGEKEAYPSVFFKLLIEAPLTSGGESTPTPEEKVAEEPAVEAPATEEPTNETIIEETPILEEPGVEAPATEEPTNETIIEETPILEEPGVEAPVVEEVPTEPLAEEPVVEEPVVEESTPTPITGNVIGGIGEFFKNIFTGNVVSEALIIQGDVKNGEDFTYSTNSGNIVSVIEGSIQTEEKILDESVLNILNDNGDITVSTNYIETSTGFGSDYMTNEVKTYSIDLNSLGVHLEAGDVIININHNGNNLINFKKTISEIITIPEDDSIKINETENKTIDEIVNETFFNQTEILTNLTVVELTNIEKNIIKSEFGLAAVNTTAENYRDKVIVSFRIGEYTLSNSYPLNLDSESLTELIEKDRIIFLKDLAKEFSNNEYRTESREDLNSLFPII